MTAPWFEEFSQGDDFSDVPAITITEGHTAVHQALFADRSALCLSQPLARKVTGENRLLANAALVCNMAIGQSTIPSQRVMGNLFYRGLLLQQPVFVGDTLATTTRCVALRQNTVRKGRAASGMVALEIDVTNQNGQTVLHFWRCPMIPCKDPDADTGRADSFDVMPEAIEDQRLIDSVPDWDFECFSREVRGLNTSALSRGEVFEVQAADTVTLAPELVRMTLNMAMTHTDARRSVYGKRLVYGGHTISMAAAQLTRVMPNLVSVLCWYRCDHTAPVFEEDILTSRVTILDVINMPSAALVKLQIEVFADRGPNAPEGGQAIKVLDWQLAALVA